jgi:predicted metal-binding membrane protein
MDTSSGFERVVRQDRLIVLSGLAAITLLSWIFLVRMASSMNAAATDAAMHAAMGMPEMAEWGMAELVMLFLMWTVMMVAMMLPSASPVVLLVVSTYRRRGGNARALSVAFASGYLAVWTAFSMVAAVLQLVLHRVALLSPSMATRSAVAGGAILLVAGAYQWLPLKNTCLIRCRSPLAFIATEWREGAGGAFTMGFRHGLYCLGCCWALMLLLFAAGVMNLIWVAAIALFVLLEKVAPRGVLLGRAAGLLLMIWGAWVVMRAL